MICCLFYCILLSVFLVNMLNYLKSLEQVPLFIYYFIDRFREFCEVRRRSAHFKSFGRRCKLFRAVTVGHCQRGCLFLCGSVSRCALYCPCSRSTSCSSIQADRNRQSRDLLSRMQYCPRRRMTPSKNRVHCTNEPRRRAQIMYNVSPLLCIL